MACLAMLILLVFIGLQDKSAHYTANRGATGAGIDQSQRNKMDSCYTQSQSYLDVQTRIVLSESIPLYMEFGANATFGIPTYDVWKDLLTHATRSVNVASFYWTLTDYDIGVNSTTDSSGRDILAHLEELPSRNVSVQVVTSVPSVPNNSTDLEVLTAKGIHVRKVNFGNLTGGILHSKFWIVDMKHIYIGSANMDWRALTQVKELGVAIYECPHLAEDLYKIFRSYWVMGLSNTSVPEHWPPEFDTSINRQSPLLVNMSGVASRMYFSGSPPSFCPSNRTRDLDAILSVIEEAEQFINVAVMEYFPTSRFTQPRRYWPVIEDALKQAAFERQVAVRLLVSCGQDTDPDMLPYLRSLSSLYYPAENISIEVKVYIVPVGNQSDIPHSRVNHNKYMVTDKTAYIGTSNWSSDYFTTTAGVGLVVTQEKSGSGPQGPVLQEQLRVVFERDWNSQFAIKLCDLHHNPYCAFTKEL